VSAERVAELRQSLPELPEQMRDRFVAQYGLPAYDAGVLTQSMPLARYFEATAAAAGNAKAASNWIMGEVLGRLNAAGMPLSAMPITPEALAGLIRLVESGRITGPIAKGLFERMFAGGGDAEVIVTAEGLGRIADDQAIGGKPQRDLEQLAQVDRRVAPGAGAGLELDPLVALDRTGQPPRLVGGRCQQCFAKRCVRRTEGNPLEALAVVAAGDAADMAVANDARL